MAGSCGWFPLSYDEIAAWVDAHADSLPQTLEELAAFPIPFRKVIVNRVSPEQRTMFWREHLCTFLGPNSTLSAAQREFVEEAIEELPLIFGKPLPEAQARMRPLEDRMRGLLTREQAAAMFGVVGPAEPPGGLPIPAGAMKE